MFMYFGYKHYTTEEETINTGWELTILLQCRILIRYFAFETKVRLKRPILKLLPYNRFMNKFITKFIIFSTGSCVEPVLKV